MEGREETPENREVKGDLCTTAEPRVNGESKVNGRPVRWWSLQTESIGSRPTHSVWSPGVQVLIKYIEKTSAQHAPGQTYA